MSDQEPTPVAAPSTQHAGAAILLRILQGAHPDDAASVREWLATLPAKLQAVSEERDQWKAQAMSLLFGEQNLLEQLQEKTKYVNQLIESHQQRVTTTNETLRSFAGELNAVVSRYTTVIRDETENALNA